VVVRADADEQGICADRLCCAFCHVAHHDRVMVRSRRLEQQLPEQRMGRAGEFQQLHKGCDAKSTADYQEGDEGQTGRQYPVRERGQQELHQSQSVVHAVDKLESQDNSSIPERNVARRGHERIQLVDAGDGQRTDQAAD